MRERGKGRDRAVQTGQEGGSDEGRCESAQRACLVLSSAHSLPLSLSPSLPLPQTQILKYLSLCASQPASFFFPPLFLPFLLVAGLNPDTVRKVYASHVRTFVAAGRGGRGTVAAGEVGEDQGSGDGGGSILIYLFIYLPYSWSASTLTPPCPTFFFNPSPLVSVTCSLR
jgi:hypothetical protein